MMYHIPAVLSSQEVDDFIAQLQQAEWVDGRVTTGDLGAQVKNNQQVDTRSNLYAELQGNVLAALNRSSLFFAAALPKAISSPLFNRYQQSETYGFHVDGAVRSQAQGGWMRTDLSATLFLAEPDAYDGGVLEVDGPFGVQPVKLAAGDMVLYPSSSLHRVTPVTRGARLASFFWIESLVADETERSLLFDLDQSVQRFTPLVAPDDARLVQLSGVYHNLLRRWARP